MLRPAAHASRLTGDIMQRWVGFRSVLRCKSGLVPNQELLRVRSGWHGINLKAYSSTVYFAYHTFGYYKIKQTTLVLNKGKSNLNFTDARTRICHAVRWPSPTSWVAPPHSPASIKRCISRVEKTPALVHADLFANVLCDTPLKEGHISILHTDGPGLTPNQPMAVVQMPIEIPSIPDGKYFIRNRAADIYWHTSSPPYTTVYFCVATMEYVKSNKKWMQVNKHSLIIQVFKKR